VPAAGEGSSAVDFATSQSPAGGGGAESSTAGTITTSAPPGPVPTGSSNVAWGTVVSVTVLPSSTPVVVASGVARPTPPPRWPRPTPLDLHRERLGAWRLETGLGGHDPRAQGQALQGREAEHVGVGMPTRR
jgi:hypothetical protein